MAKEAPKVNPKDFGFDKTAWDDIDANYRNWIVLNKELFKNLTKFSLFEIIIVQELLFRISLWKFGSNLIS